MTLKNTLKYFFTNIIIGLFLFSCFTTPIHATSTQQTDFSVHAKASLAIDFETGKILYADNADTKLEIASLTKLISLYIIQEKIADGTLTWETPVTISEEVASLSKNWELSNIPLSSKKTYTVKQLFDAATIISANAATIALAEKVAGTEFAFVDLMKEQLEEWGISDPFIINSSGLNNADIPGEHYPGSAEDAENKLSATELAIVTRHLIQDFPQTLEVSSQAVLNYESDGKKLLLYSTNLLLPDMPLAKKGVDGLKTGTTDLAGRSFISTMKKENQRVITVLLNATDQEDPNARYTETSRLLDYVYDYWEKKTVITKGQTIDALPPVPVEKSLVTSIPLIATDSIELFVPRHQGLKAITYQIKGFDDTKKIVAPIEKNSTLAEVTVVNEADTLGYLEESVDATTSFVTSESAEKASFFEFVWHKIKNLF